MATNYAEAARAATDYYDFTTKAGVEVEVFFLHHATTEEPQGFWYWCILYHATRDSCHRFDAYSAKGCNALCRMLD